MAIASLKVHTKVIFVSRQSEDEVDGGSISSKRREFKTLLVDPPPNSTLTNVKTALTSIDSATRESAHPCTTAIYTLTEFVTKNPEYPTVISEEHDNAEIHNEMKRNIDVDENHNFPNTKRNRCMMELLETEINYVENGLIKIVKHLQEPLQGIIPHDDHQSIFGNIENLLSLHKLMLEDIRIVVRTSLAAPMSPSDQPMPLSHRQFFPQYVGDVFAKYRYDLLAYGQYCSNLSESRETINRLMNCNNSIRIIIEQCQKFDGNRFSLTDLLAMPFQRITKYPLLIKELIGKTDPSSPEMSSLQVASEIIKDICDYVNVMLQDTEMQKFVSKIEKRILRSNGIDFSTFGRINFDGEVMMFESTATQIGRKKRRFVFIFDKVLVICKSINKGSTYTYKNSFSINELSVSKIVLAETNVIEKITKRKKYVINLYRDETEMNKIVHIAVFFKNEISRKKWLDAFILSKTNVSPEDLIKNTNHKVTLTTFKVNLKQPEVCGVCDKLIKGLYFQGYKCDHCQVTMHKDCLASNKCNASQDYNTMTYNFAKSRSLLKNCRRKTIMPVRDLE